jgi:hypothetical protein
MTLLEKQFKFTRLVAELIAFAYTNGYNVSLGEAWRPPETASLYASQGKGIKDSLHCARLAIDLNLFKGKAYLTKTEDYRKLGIFWESLSCEDYKCCWGGRFKDGTHFSIEHNGVK